jgi:hypothetical protein
MPIRFHGKLLAATLVSLATSAQAGSYGAPPALAPVTQGIGCFWYRGVLTCSRYCYWEIDGARYCQRNAREAVSQAPALIIDDPASREQPLRRRSKSLK